MYAPPEFQTTEIILPKDRTGKPVLNFGTSWVQAEENYFHEQELKEVQVFQLVLAAL